MPWPRTSAMLIADLVLVAVEVEEVAAVVGQQAVDGDDVRAEVGERAAEVRADEAEPAGDEDAAARGRSRGGPHG